MRRLDLKFSAAAECLAADEVLLDECEAGRHEEMLFFWEPAETFVVLGYANKVATEVNQAACAERGVPIFRRCSGGGTVVQMRGGLNYSLILRIEPDGPARNISAANQFIMEKNRQAIQAATGNGTVAVRGHTDLVMLTSPDASTALKFAGNAQRRRKHFLLFHGTLLLNCELKLIAELLRMPSLQPDYRANRRHEEFVMNLKLRPEAVKNALADAWKAEGMVEVLPLEEIRRVARDKYATEEWNYKF